MKEETINKLRKVLWNPINPKPHIWDKNCECDSCQKNNEIAEILNDQKN